MENRSLIKKVLETDPAARYALNVIINYPGVHAMFGSIVFCGRNYI